MTVNVEVTGDLDPFDCSPEGRTTIQLPWYNEEVAGYFWPAVNAPTYMDSAVKVAELVNYVYNRAYQEGVRSILGRDS